LVSVLLLRGSECTPDGIQSDLDHGFKVPRIATIVDGFLVLFNRDDADAAPRDIGEGFPIIEDNHGNESLVFHVSIVPVGGGVVKRSRLDSR